MGMSKDDIVTASMWKYLPKIIFNYISIDNLGGLDEIIQSSLESPEALEDLTDHYVLLKVNSMDRIHTCTINDVLLNEIFPDKKSSKSITDPQRNYYHLVEKYGIDIVNKFIISDPSIITDKVKNVIEFGMDKVYHKNKLVIQFPTIKDLIPAFIFNALQRYFRIITAFPKSDDIVFVIDRNKEEKKHGIK